MHTFVGRHDRADSSERRCGGDVKWQQKGSRSLIVFEYISTMKMD